MAEVILDIQDVSIGIDDKTILSHLDISIEKGDFIFLKGRNGSGKTSFLNVLAHYNPSGKCRVSGKMLYQDGRDILSQKDTQWYKREIYYIPQVQEDMDNTVYERFFYVMNTIENISENKVLNFFETHDIQYFFPGISPRKLLHRKTNALSEGQKKIIEIFAGMMRGAYMKILLFDEPLNHLDTGNIKKVIDMFLDLRKENHELAVILTTHCQAFPKPTKSLIIQSNAIRQSETPYVHYNCFDDDAIDE